MMNHGHLILYVTARAALQMEVAVVFVSGGPVRDGWTLVRLTRRSVIELFKVVLLFGVVVLLFGVVLLRGLDVILILFFGDLEDIVIGREVVRGVVVGMLSHELSYRTAICEPLSLSGPDLFSFVCVHLRSSRDHAFALLGRGSGCGR